MLIGCMFKEIFISLQALMLIVVAVLSQLLFAGSAHAGRIEAGTFVAHDTLTVGTRNPVRVNFQQAFDVTPIVVAISNQTGNSSLYYRF